MSESIPSSVTGFAHRRPRADSVASFTYFQEEDESPEWSINQAIADEEDEDGNVSKPTDGDSEFDLESGSTSPKRRKSSAYSRTSADHPLLSRFDSTKSNASGAGKESRTSHKLYIVAEDLTIVVAGFGTRSFGFALYSIICILSAGLGYLVFRWLPRWRVRLIGSPKPLIGCKWVVIEVRSLCCR